MSGYIGFTRVSTLKQGIHGVSLQEQKAAILRYAEKHKFTVTIWLEEMETAAKQGRKIFGEMLTMLRKGQARGVIVHKLDRGVRNLKDWADMGELVDQGVEVHFANEGLDLHSRGGRLSADIQAVVAADYIRNLREETKKGFYGRLNQGFYPLQAPVGYLDQGKAKAKIIDPVKGPLVRKAFELYGTSCYSLESLAEEMTKLGLRTRKGKIVSVTSLSLIFNNPFYIGIMKISKTGEAFPGLHEPLVSQNLFKRVQEILSGKSFRRTQRHKFLFRRLIACQTCCRSLVGESQKGHVYYRCQTRSCPTTSIRQEVVEAALRGLLARINFNEDEIAAFRAKAMEYRKSWIDEKEDHRKTAFLHLGQIKDRLGKLTDAFLDGAIEKELFMERKNALVTEQKRLELDAMETGKKPTSADPLEIFLELAGKALLSYETGNAEEKRKLVKIVTSNRYASGKNVVFEPSNPFRVVANRSENLYCGPERGEPRTIDEIVKELGRLNERGELPCLDEVLSFVDKDNNIVSN